MNTPVMFQFFPRVILMMLFTVLISCGGGGGDDTPAPPPGPVIENGVFRDANVEGLSFASGGESGLTDSQGVFTYEVGEPVTFSVGGIELGTVSGQPIITPMDLVNGADVTTLQVQNIVRFLLMLDTDDTTFGIQITDNVRTALADFDTLDFTANDFAAEVDTIAIMVRSADGLPHILPDTATAQTHLTSTLFCARAGIFNGTFSGDDRGRFGLVFSGQNGFLGGFGFSTEDDIGFGILGSMPSVLNQAGTFSSETSNGSTFSGSFTSLNVIEGTWGNAQEGSSGTFTGNRFGGAPSVPFKFSGGYNGNGGSIGTFSFDIDTENNVTGRAFDLVDNSTSEFTGTISGGVNNEYTLSVSNADGLQAVASINLVTGTITNGLWTGEDGESGQFVGDGCRAN